MAKLTTIEGIGDTLAAKLKAAGVGSVEALLNQGGSASGRATIAEAAGIDSKRILRFVNHADLMRIKGVGGEYAELLEAAGVDTVPELAQRNPGNLLVRMTEVNEEKKLVRALPSPEAINNWVAQAKTMDRAIHH